MTISTMDTSFQAAKKGIGVSSLGYYGLLLILIFEFARPNNFYPLLNSLKLNSLIPLIVLGLSIFAKNEPLNSLILKDKSTVWIGFLLLLISISILTSDVTLYSFKVFETVLGWSFLYFIIRKQVNTLKRLIGVFITLISLHFLIIIINPALILNPETRNYLAGGPFTGDGNDYALSACTVIPMAYFMMQTSRRLFFKIFWFICALGLYCSVISTQSRGGTIALGCLTLYLILKSEKMILGLLFGVVIVPVVLLFAPQQYFDRMKSINNYQQEGSAQGRILVWKSAIRMATDHPLLGVGAGHFPVKYGVEYRPEGYGRTQIPWQTAHSMYFLALGELGFPGILFLIGILIANFVKLSRFKKPVKLQQDDVKLMRISESFNNCLFASLIGLAVGGAFLSVLYYPHLYILTGLIGSRVSMPDEVGSESGGKKASGETY
jgi:probable O-glycosylation ligase (exosortase A-associated)